MLAAAEGKQVNYRWYPKYRAALQIGDALAIAISLTLRFWLRFCSDGEPQKTEIPAGPSHKFRTTRIDAGQLQPQSNRSDGLLRVDRAPGITRIARDLRRYSLYEFPSSGLSWAGR